MNSELKLLGAVFALNALLLAVVLAAMVSLVPASASTLESARICPAVLHDGFTCP